MMAQNKGGSALLKTEDWLAVWLGVLIIILILVFPRLRPGLPKFRRGGGVGKLSGDAGAFVGKVFSGQNIWNSIKLGIAFWILSTIGIVLMGASVGKYIIGFPIVYALAWLSQFIAGNSTINYWGLEYVIFALVIGLFISNVIGIPDWLREAVRTEYYIKTGLVILGAGILFFEIVQAGALGIVQALLVVTVIWYACFWLSRKLRVDDEFAVILSTAVSICGVSAASFRGVVSLGCPGSQSGRNDVAVPGSFPMMVLMP